jgi:peroxiredoxin
VRLVVLVVAAALAGCTQDPLAEQYQSGTNQNYISGDGAVTEIPEAKRDAPIEFSGTTVDGDTVTSADYAGKPLVVNFWYAGCPPCRLESKDLASLSAQYSGTVPFLGVNTYDDASTAATFATKNGISYPSVLDASTVSMQLAFAGTVAPNAVPTTIVLDSEGRVAGRISGFISDPLILSAMIDRVLAEAK